FFRMSYRVVLGNGFDTLFRFDQFHLVVPEDPSNALSPLLLFSTIYDENVLRGTFTPDILSGLTLDPMPTTDTGVFVEHLDVNYMLDVGLGGAGVFEGYGVFAPEGKVTTQTL